MTKNPEIAEPIVELRAQAIECRVIGENLTLLPVQFQIDQGLKAEQPQLVMYLRGCLTAAEALSMLKAVRSRIQSSGLPNMKMRLPGEIVGRLEDILERVGRLAEPVRDGIASYVEERLTAISTEEVDHD